MTNKPKQVAVIGPILGQVKSRHVYVCYGIIKEDKNFLRVNGVVLKCGFGNNGVTGIDKIVSLPSGLFTIHPYRSNRIRISIKRVETKTVHDISWTDWIRPSIESCLSGIKVRRLNIPLVSDCIFNSLGIPVKQNQEETLTR